MWTTTQGEGQPTHQSLSHSALPSIPYNDKKELASSTLKVAPRLRAVFIYRHTGIVSPDTRGIFICIHVFINSETLKEAQVSKRWVGRSGAP